jgi:hypothetical protein
MERKCSMCGTKLSPANPGTVCHDCQTKKVAQLADKDASYYTAEELTYILGLECEESVKRLGRKGKIPGRLPGIKKHLYSKEAVDAWIKSGYIIKKMPASPLQSEAYEMCTGGDHGWMREERFQGHACKVETSASAEIQGNRIPMTCRLTCHFCGHVDLADLA